MFRNPFPVILAIVCAVSISCSGGSSPILPGIGSTSGPELSSGQSSNSNGQTSKAIWGIWNVTINKNTMQVDVVPVRGVQFTVDVVTFLQPPMGNPVNLQIAVNDIPDWLTEGLLGVDVGLTHPFPGLDEYTGFDVYGVFVTTSSLTGQYDNDVTRTNGVDNPILLNADGYSRWMNPLEFPDDGTILSFNPGALGDQNTELFTATINGYKYFTDGLDAEQDVGEFLASDPTNVDRRGYFRPGSTNHRQYNLKFPLVDDVPTLVFQYAVIASWIEPDPSLSGDPDLIETPGDFMISANADEAFFLGITDNSTAYYVDGNGGGDIRLDLEVFDWGAYADGVSVLDEVHQIIIEGDPNVIPGGFATFDNLLLQASASQGSTAISSVFQVEIQNVLPENNDDLPLLITIENESPENFDPGTGVPANDDRLAAYFLYNLPIPPEIELGIIVTSPNGGETLYMTLNHEITWEHPDLTITDVKIEYSKDDFNSDIIEIVDSTPNDGSYTWVYIPKDESDTVIIRISDVSGPKSDDSDDYFAIKPPVWLNFQDPVQVSNATVTFSSVDYFQDWDDISPALSQDHDGQVDICWHNEKAFPNDPPPNGHRLARDPVIRSYDGNSWTGQGGFLFTSGGTAAPIHELRRDYMKLAPAANNTTFAAVWHWSIYFSLDVDHLINGHNYYNAWCLFNRIYLASEIMADDDYVYLVSDGAVGVGNGPGIYSYRYDTPNWAWPGQYDPKPSMNTLSGYGELSHSRSWAFQGDQLVLAYWTTAGQIKLLRQTDQTLDTWDDTEVIFDGTDYVDCKDPSLCSDPNGQLFAVWQGQEISSGEYHLLASMLDSPGGTWTSPMVITSRTIESFDDQHITNHNQLYTLPDDVDENLLLVGYEVDGQVFSQIILGDAWDWLPAQEVSLSTDVSRDPDVICPDVASNYSYDAIFTWSHQIIPGTYGYGDYDILFRNADFETP